MMKKILYILLLALCACKTQSTIALRAHNPPSTIIHDSVSVTYKQGKVVSLAENAENADQERNNICELGDEEPRDSYRSYKNSDSLRTVPQSGTTMPLEKSAKSASSARAIRIRVDTVFIERWHTEQVTGNRTKETSYIKHQTFYKRCTAGFWVLLIGILIWIALRIWKAIYLRK